MTIAFLTPRVATLRHLSLNRTPTTENHPLSLHDALPIFRAIGWQASPFVDQKAKGEYAWRDIERQCRKHGLELSRPSVFPRPSLTPLRVALAGSTEPWIGDFCREVMRMNFVRDVDIDSVDAVSGALGRLGLPVGPIISQALSDANKLALREQTEQARRHGLFGAPTFFVGDEMFWGNDRLDDALEYAIESTR